jgi:hypothetical protein
MFRLLGLFTLPFLPFEALLSLPWAFTRAGVEVFRGGINGWTHHYSRTPPQISMDSTGSALGWWETG